MLRLKGVEAAYGTVPVLFGVDIEVGEGEIVALVGTNGAGKTTVLRVISGVLAPSRGLVLWEGVRITRLPPADIVRLGVVQMPGGRGVFPGMTVQENLEIGGHLYGRDAARRRQGVVRALEMFPAIAARRHQVAGSLSGGEQQMVALARAFVMQPRLLLIDELSLGLAPRVLEDLLDTIRRLNAAGVAVLLVDQRVDLALDMSSRAYFLERGRVRFSGRSERLRGRDDLLRSVFLGAITAGKAPRALTR